MIYYDKKSEKGVDYDERLIIGVPVFEKEYNKQHEKISKWENMFFSYP